MKKVFNFIPATIWINWEEKFITYYGSSNHFINHNEVLYFFNDGCHVATKNDNKVSFNPEINLPKEVKRLIRITNI